MNTRTLAALLTLVPASGLVAQDLKVTAAPTSVVRRPNLLISAKRVAPVTTSSGSLTPVPTYVAYANCDGSVQLPIVNALDLSCFISRAGAGHAYANCDGSTGTPLITANDYHCFMNAFSLATQWQTEQGNLDPVR